MIITKIIRRAAADEYMAHLAESGVEASVWEKVRNAIVKALRRLGFDISLSDADIRGLLRESYGALTADGHKQTPKNTTVGEVRNKLNESVRFSVNNKEEIEQYDKANGTELGRFVDYLERGKKLKEGEKNYFKVGVTSPLLNKYGMNGKISVGNSTFNKRHSVDGHELSNQDWLDLITNINEPIAIARYTKRKDKKAFRVYTPVIVNGQLVCAGVDVNTEAENSEVTNVSTAFGRDIERIGNGQYEELVYPLSREKLEKALEEHSTAPNSRLYPQKPDANIQQKSEPASEKGEKNSGGIRFSVSNANQEIFVSNAARAVEGIRQEKATPEQWLKMVEKNGGLKAGEVTMPNLQEGYQTMHSIDVTDEMKESVMQGQPMFSIAPDNKDDGDFSENNLRGTEKDATFAAQYQNDYDNADNGTNVRMDAQPEGTPRGSNGRSEANAGEARGLGRDSQTDGRGQGSPGLAKPEQEQLIREQAMKDGTWMTDDDLKSITAEPLASGKESKVFMSKDGRSVVKVIDYSVYSKTPSDFQRDRIDLFNRLFPDTAYELLGYTENADGNLCFVVKQPYIGGTLLGHYWAKSKGKVSYSDLEPMLEKWMLDNYGMQKYGLDAFENDEIRVQDLHLKNVKIDADGRMYVIDAIPSLKKTDDDIRFSISPPMNPTAVLVTPLSRLK